MKMVVLKLVVWIIVVLAKVLTFSSRMFQKGSGTALPGLLVENYAKWVVAELTPDYQEVILISGTNGKTTTRALLVHIYEQNSVPVCTNRGGANIFRGIAAAILANTKLNLKPRYPTAILEVEEATLPILTEYLKPTKLILTNIFRDQLDAYGEIDKTVGFFRQTLAKTRPVVYINTEDNKLLTCLDNFDGPVVGFSLDFQTKPKYEKADATFANFAARCVATEIQTYSDKQQFTIQTTVKHFSGNLPTGLSITTTLPGVYNLYNVLVAAILGYEKFGQHILEPLANFRAVFGRGEKAVLGQAELELFLIKNPAGFEQVLQDIHRRNSDTAIQLVILINDNIADGRDVSWLWDVDLESFIRSQKIAVIKTGGQRGLDMLLRLEYAGAKVVATDYLEKLTEVVDFLKKQHGKVFVLSTYTATLALRQELSKHTLMSDMTSSGN